MSIKNIFAKTCCSCCGRRQGNYLVSLYMICKIIFIINAVGQLFFMNFFLGMDFHMYGFDVLDSVINGEDWTTSARFPRVTMCDLKVRRLGNIQRYTVQCVLPINLFNEAIFLFIWCWFVFVALMACCTLLSWALKSALQSSRVDYIRKHLDLQNKVQEHEDDDDLDIDGYVKGSPESCLEFTSDYLRQDGVFVLRLAGANTNAITVTEFICSLWDYWLNNILPKTFAEKKKEKADQEKAIGDEAKRQEEERINDFVNRHERELRELQDRLPMQS